MNRISEMGDSIISDLVGKPFRLGERGPEFYDCYGLILEIAKRRGFYLPDYGSPEDVELRMAIMEKIDSEYVKLISEPEPYSVVVFEPGLVLTSVHCGAVLLNCKSFIHAGGLSLNPLKKSVRIEALDNWPWRNRVFGFFRLVKEIN